MDNSTLAETFEEQAVWRDGKVAEYPDDERNAAAAKHLRMLAESSVNVDDHVLAAAEEFYEDAADIEAWSEMMRTVGFSYFPKSALQFVNDFIRNRSSGSIV